MGIKGWPAGERPRERLLARGPESLGDADLLVIFLRTGVRGKSAVDLARELLTEFGGLRPLLAAPREAFCRGKGLGEAKYVQLQAVLEMARRHLWEELERGGTIDGPDVAGRYLAARLRDRRLNDSEVRIVNPVPRKFFGFEPVDVLGYTVKMSGIEKTAIDCIDRPDLCGGIGEAAIILAAASRRCDWSKVASYLERIASKPLTQRCGWLADHAGAEIPADARAQMLQLASKSRKAFLGPKKAPTSAIGYDEKWHLTVNVTPAELHGSAGLGRKQSIRRDT